MGFIVLSFIIGFIFSYTLMKIFFSGDLEYQKHLNEMFRRRNDSLDKVNEELRIKLYANPGMKIPDGMNGNITDKSGTNLEELTNKMHTNNKKEDENTVNIPDIVGEFKEVNIPDEKIFYAYEQDECKIDSKHVGEWKEVYIPDMEEFAMLNEEQKLEYIKQNEINSVVPEEKNKNPKPSDYLYDSTKYFIKKESDCDFDVVINSLRND